MCVVHLQMLKEWEKAVTKKGGGLKGTTWENVKKIEHSDAGRLCDYCAQGVGLIHL